jgi:cytochrome c2
VQARDIGIGLLICLGCAACERTSPLDSREAAQRHGAVLISELGCGACHTIPGIAGADGNVGPSLARIGSRIYVAGVLRNSPDNLARWIQNPQAIVPGNVMPDMHIGEADAHDISAYLLSLH